MSDDDGSAGLDAGPRRGGGGRRQGIKNYNNRILIPIIEEILPNGSEAWRLVASAYKEQSGESNFRLEDDLKRNWVRKLCNNMKKPTGRSGAGSNDRTNRCIEIQQKILDKTASGILGASSDDDNRFAPSSPSLSLSSSSDGEVGPGTELQVSPLPFQSNDDVESTDGNEATANAEATDVAESSANICAITEGSTEDTTPDVEVAFATSTHSRPSSVARRLSPHPSSSMSTSAPPIPQPQKVQSSRMSKTNKTKNATNRERGSVTKSIERIASSIAGGSGEDMRMMLEMRKMEWEEAEERRRQEREEARREREDMRQERMEMEDRRERRFERQMQQQSEMMQMMMAVMMGGARGSNKKSEDNDDNSGKQGE